MMTYIDVSDDGGIALMLFYVNVDDDITNTIGAVMMTISLMSRMTTMIFRSK